MFDVTIENAFDFSSPHYAELFERSAATAFQHPAWLAALYGRLLAHNAAKPLIIVVRFRSDNSLAMVLPLVRRRYFALRVVEFADLRVSDYVAPVVDQHTFSRILADADACRKIRSLAQPYDLMRIGKLRDGSLPVETLFDIRDRQSMGMNAYATALADSFPEWRQQRLNRSYRKELDKKFRQLRRRGETRFECETEPGVIRTVFEAMKQYRGQRFQGKESAGDLLQFAPYFDFYLHIATEGRDGFARAYSLWLDDRPIAGVLGLAHRSSFLVILGGFDQQGFKNQSIGSLMFEQVARDCIERGEKLLDFTIGDEPYKLTFGAEAAPMWQISRAGSSLGFAAGLMVEKLPAAKALARRLFHASPGISQEAASEPQPTAVDEPVAS